MDEELLKKAEKLTCVDWSIAFEYSKIAEKKETKDFLYQLGKDLYRKEEYFANLL
jgi:hypothetical protein